MMDRGIFVLALLLALGGAGCGLHRQCFDIEPCIEPQLRTCSAGPADKDGMVYTMECTGGHQGACSKFCAWGTLTPAEIKP